MGAVVIPAAEGLVELGAAIVAAVGARELLEGVDTNVRTTERDCADTPDATECKQCKLGDGRLGQAREPRFISAKNLINYRYQLYIANLYAGPERFVFTRYRDAANEEVNVTWERIKEFFKAGDGPMTTTEWLYNGIWFDGFWRRYCTVVEAKGNYEWMFSDDPKSRPFFGELVANQWRKSYLMQRSAMSKTEPRGRLEWHFMQEKPWLEALSVDIPASVAMLTPPPKKLDVLKMIKSTFRVQQESLDLKDGYERLMSFLRSLESIYPVEAWHRIPRDPETLSGWILVSDADIYLRRAARDLGDDREQYHGLPEGFNALIASASDAASYAMDGRAVMNFDPSTGYVVIKVIEPGTSSRITFERTRNMLLTACNHLSVDYAFCDRPMAPRPSGRPGETYYGVDHRVFPHREFLGWMGFVKGTVHSHEVPEADELVPIPGKDGTMIVAVADAFDVHNPAHIQKAQRVEMRLVDLDLLPVIDPRFL